MPRELMEESTDQEMINLHKEIYDVNQRLNILSSQIAQLSLKHDKSAAKLESLVDTLRIDVENHKAEIKKLSHENSQEIGNIATSCDLYQRDVQKQIDSLQQNKLHVDAYIDGYDRLELAMYEINQAIEKKQDYFNEAVRELRNHVAEQSAILRKDLTIVKPEVDPLEKAVKEDITAFRIEMKGINKELILLKKHRAYNEKKFENIYTLIDRMKGAQ